MRQDSAQARNATARRGRDAAAIGHARDEVLLRKRGREVDEPLPHAPPQEGEHEMTRRCEETRITANADVDTTRCNRASTKIPE